MLCICTRYTEELDALIGNVFLLAMIEVVLHILFIIQNQIDRVSTAEKGVVGVASQGLDPDMTLENAVTTRQLHSMGMLKIFVIFFDVDPRAAELNH